MKLENRNLFGRSRVAMLEKRRVVIAVRPEFAVNKKLFFAIWVDFVAFDERGQNEPRVIFRLGAVQLELPLEALLQPLLVALKGGAA